jgi:hypothetical protein
MTRRRFPLRAGQPNVGALNVGVQLTRRPSPAMPTPRGQSVPGCTPSIEGLQLCVFNSAINPLDVDGTTYTMSAEPSTSTCYDADVDITIAGGYLPSEMSGTWVFGLVGNTCGCEPEFSYVFERDPDSLWTEILQPIVCGTSLIIVAPSPGIGGSGYATGVLTVAAACNGVTYGPLLVTIAAGGGY